MTFIPGQLYLVINRQHKIQQDRNKLFFSCVSQSPKIGFVCLISTNIQYSVVYVKNQIRWLDKIAQKSISVLLDVKFTNDGFSDTV